MEYKHTYRSADRNNTRQYCVYGIGLRETNYRDFESFEKRIKSIKKKGLVLHNVQYSVRSDTYFVSFTTVKDHNREKEHLRNSTKCPDELFYYFRNGKMIGAMRNNIYREILPSEKSLWQIGLAYIEAEEKMIAEYRMANRN